jgi:hypothetical protein
VELAPNKANPINPCSTKNPNNLDYSTPSTTGGAADRGQYGVGGMGDGLIRATFPNKSTAGDLSAKIYPPIYPPDLSARRDWGF